MIRLDDQAIIVGLQRIQTSHLEEYALEILAHEVGHHVYCPGDLADQARMLVRIRKSLPGHENVAPMIANLYADLLINDRLQRSHKLRMDAIYRKLNKDAKPDRLWTLYMRIYEILWSIKRGELAKGPIDPPMEGDAQLGAKLIRSYARDWLHGAGRFGALCLPYLIKDGGKQLEKIMRQWHDTVGCGAGAQQVPAGLTEIEDDENESIHPADDPLLNDSLSNPADSQKDASHGADISRTPNEIQANVDSRGQCREPFEYGQILKSLGLNLTDHEIAVRYYRERAIPYLVRFPAKPCPQSVDPLPEGLEPWTIGSSLEDIDWTSSVFSNAHLIPGMTTLQRVWGTSEGNSPESKPIDLDLYVDSSGSMPNPQMSTSYLTLAGAIICLSALRAGARVQVTLWSGTRQFITTNGFIQDETKILEVLTGFFGGATAFPIHILRDTFEKRSPSARPVHVMCISDEGVDTMFAKDERNNDGKHVAKMALEKGGAGGSLVLNIATSILTNQLFTEVKQQGWEIFAVQSWDQLVRFAKEFSERVYA